MAFLTYRCSTPFGISDGFTSNKLTFLLAKKVCSTPFGISDGFTCRESLSALRDQSAQRLSASQMASLALPNHPAHTLPVLNAFRHLRWLHFSRIDARSRIAACSTPFGISDGFTLDIQPGHEFAVVLNAFRHLR